MKIWDVIIVGGGPAGLNAAVVLGRCRRSVLIFDTGKQRNRLSHGIHNYLTRDDVLPADFLNIAYKEIRKYRVTLKRTQVIHAEKLRTNIFFLRDNKGNDYYSKKLLIATGLTDNIPPIKNIEQFYGKTIFHCPYCDAWEVKDKKIGIYAKNKNGLELALSLRTWSEQVTLYTDGRNYLKEPEKKLLQKKNVKIIPDKIESLDGRGTKLTQIIFRNGSKLPCDAIFILNGYRQQSAIAKTLGCEMSSQAVLNTNRQSQTNIPGLYAAGDASKDVQFVVVAAAEGAKAGVNINKELQKEENQK
jgi:thioredoxin reductase